MRILGEKIKLTTHCYLITTRCHNAISKRSASRTAFNLDIPTEDEETGKKLTVDALKDEILENSGEDTLLILPEAKRLTTSIRYWLEDMMSAGVIVVCLAVVNPKKEIFLEMLEIELDLPSDRDIREIMEAEAQRQGLSLTKLITRLKARYSKLYSDY